ncbi:MAG TPA: NAD(P)-binding domain-containing protein, partial [Gemmatimonadales bacterium]|nr:NAD(P)-binding domain-containing protein [Gemmatimonadales bacterium]
MTRVAVLGAGSWGTTLAHLLACKGDDVRLWAFEPDVADAINRTHENPVFLAGVALAPELRATSDAAEAVKGAEVVVSAPPSHAVRAVVTPLARAVRDGTLVVSATKGIEAESLALMSQVFAECLPQARFAVLSG